jgi:predicted lactoylglutathione lyase
MKIEVVTLPVSDVDRAKRFYQSLGGGSTPTSSWAMPSAQFN